MKSIFKSLVMFSILMAIPVMTNAAMTYEQAVEYRKNTNADLREMVVTEKDENNYKTKKNVINVCGTMGAFSNIMKSNYTYIQPRFVFGQVDNPEPPYYEINWCIGTTKGLADSVRPEYIYVNFTDQTTYKLPIKKLSPMTGQGVYFTRVNLVGGLIKLKEFQIYELSKKGNVCSVEIDTGIPNAKRVLLIKPNEDKQLKRFTESFQHAFKIMDIDLVAVEQQKQEFEKEDELKLRKELEEEIRAEQARAKLKQQIYEEMKARGEI